MIFLVDQNLQPSLAEWFRGEGFSAGHLRNLGLASSTDYEVTAHARGSGAIIVTRDGDFQNVAGLPPQGVRVIWVRIGNTTNPQLLASFERLWPEIEEALAGDDVLIELT